MISMQNVYQNLKCLLIMINIYITFKYENQWIIIKFKSEKTDTDTWNLKLN